MFAARLPRKVSLSYLPLPVPAALLRELYVDIGLSIHHIALLIGLGDFASRNRLIQVGVTFRGVECLYP